MNVFHKVFKALIAGLFVVGGSNLLAGCEDDGPFEEAGESIDEAAEEIDEEI